MKTRWRVTTEKPSPLYVGLVCIVSDDLSVVTHNGEESAPDGWEANARLIAAAPELLAACRVALSSSLLPSVRDELLAAIRLANSDEGPRQ